MCEGRQMSTGETEQGSHRQEVKPKPARLVLTVPVIWFSKVKLTLWIFQGVWLNQTSAPEPERLRGLDQV